MRAAKMFLTHAQSKSVFDQIAKVKVELYGSLAFTGRGHGTDKAIMLGLEGDDPETVNTDTINARWESLDKNNSLNLLGTKTISFNHKEDLQFIRKKTLPLHSNGMKFLAMDSAGSEILAKIYYSVGGGFVVDEKAAQKDELAPEKPSIPYPFSTAKELLQLCQDNKLTIAELMMANEMALRPKEEILGRLSKIWDVMDQGIERGCSKEGILPGSLKVKRRAPELFKRLAASPRDPSDSLIVMDWVNLFAIAVNEENASGARVVTAPTNGAAGIIPAVIRYYSTFCKKADQQGIYDFLLTAGAIGILYALNASISGAEVGCQGEVGVACSMAAGGLAAALGGTIQQVEQAAEIGMEHNLGLTCDPIGGLVQIPCIERNAMGAVKAINASRIALRGDGTHYVSLDNVIKTMRETGRDMMTKYKETSRGGLAVNVIEC
jgi:L-serine dehydratase